MREERKDGRACGRLRSPFQLELSFVAVWEVKICGNPKSLQMVTTAMKLKDAYSLEGKL